MAASMITLLVCSYYTIAIRAGQCHYTLEGMNLGINTFCQRTDLSVLDRSICEDGRMSKLFFIFIDGVPLSHFKDMTTSDKYGKYSLVFPLDNGMIDLTGPIWRTGVLGRLDGNFGEDIKTVDNVFTQIVANGGVDIEFVLHSDYPTRMTLGHPYVDESRIRVPPGGDSIRKICEGQSIFPKERNNVPEGCKNNDWNCVFDSVEESMKFLLSEKERMTNELMSDKNLVDTVHRCIDSKFDGSKGLFIYDTRIDEECHVHSNRHKMTLSMIAESRAKIELMADRILEKNPDSVIAIFGDHGSSESLTQIEWVDHGVIQNDNRGFLILLSKSFEGKSKRDPNQLVPMEQIFTHLPLLFKNGNVPKFARSIVTEKFPGDLGEKLVALRSREAQLMSLIEPRKLDRSPFEDFFDSSVSLGENLARMPEEKMIKRLEKYEAFLDKRMKPYNNVMSKLLEKNTSLLSIIGLSLSIAGVLVSYFILKATSIFSPSDTQEVICTCILIVVWFGGYMLCFDFDADQDLYYTACFCIIFGILCLSGVLKKLMQRFTMQIHQDLPWTLLGCCAILGGVISLIIKYIYMKVINSEMLSKKYIYYKNSSASNLGMVFVYLGISTLLILAWKDLPQLLRGARGLIRHKLVLGLRIVFRGLWTFVVVRIFYHCQVFEDMMLGRVKDDEKFRHFMSLNIYLSLGYALILYMIGCRRERVFSSFCVFAVIFGNFCFFANHLGKVLFTIFVLPLLLYLYLKRAQFQKQPGEQCVMVLVHLLSICLYSAYGGSYGVYVNQRAFSRQMQSSEFDIMILEYIHVFNVKFLLPFSIHLFMMIIRIDGNGINTSTFIYLFWNLLFVLKCQLCFALGINWKVFIPMICTLTYIMGIGILASHLLYIFKPVESLMAVQSSIFNEQKIGGNNTDIIQDEDKMKIRNAGINSEEKIASPESDKGL